ncbi:hypothetical protein MO973_08780 [Paenibacillus sp. TRM 82003]|nr:hypothetical protein [Paenibacillus sp. TRM 82003]
MVERVKNERTERKRRWGKAIAIVLGVAAIAAIFGNRFYNTVQAPYRTALANAEAKALDAIELRTVHSVERFVGDRPYSVVFATYGDPEEEVVVWLWDDQFHLERQADGVTREAVRALALEENPEKRLLRVAPGKMNDEYVWEVFYELTADGRTRKYYDYYRFADGRKIETYRLSVER